MPSLTSRIRIGNSSMWNKDCREAKLCIRAFFRIFTILVFIYPSARNDAFLYNNTRYSAKRMYVVYCKRVFLCSRRIETRNPFWTVGTLKLAWVDKRPVTAPTEENTSASHKIEGQKGGL